MEDHKQPDETYIGYFKNNTFHGSGKYTWSQDKFYDGEYQYGVKHGYGKLFNKGEQFNGNWDKGKKQGRGNITDAEGNILRFGEWSEGEHIKWMALDEY